jgi:O-antigen ligase
MQRDDVSSSTFILLVLVFSVIEIVCWHSFSIPLDLLDGAVSDSQTMATGAEYGSALRKGAIVAAGLIGVGLLWYAGRGKVKLDRLLGWVLLCYLAWAALSVFWSDVPDITERRLVSFFLVALAACGLATLGADRIRLFLALCCVIILAIGIGNELWLGTLTPFRAGYRFAGTLHPNSQGANDAVLILLALPGAFKPGRYRFAWIGAASVAFVILLLTGSRTALICFMVAAAVLVAVRSSRLQPHRFYIAALAVVLVASFGVVLQATQIVPPSHWITEAFHEKRDAGDIESLTGRTEVWKACLAAGTGHLRFGFGYKSFWTADRILEISSEEQWGVNQAHSAYLDELLSVGVPGLMLFILMLGLGIAAAISRYRATRSDAFLAFSALLVFAALDSLTESISLDPVSVGFAMIMVLAVLGVGRRDLATERRPQRRLAVA